MRVLIVDDDLFNLKVANGYINHYFTDYTVFLCQDPALVMGMLEKEDIDILLLDIMMPKIDGTEILRQIRKNEIYSDLQIIMLTAMEDSESFKICFELGASDYVLKPIDITVFQARLKAVAKNRSNTLMLREMIELMRHQNSELKTVNALLKDTQFHLVQSEKMAAIGELAAGVAHEINTPIGYVGSNLETLSAYLKRIKEYLVYNQVSLEDMAVKTDNPNFSKLMESLNGNYSRLKIGSITEDFENIIQDSQEGMSKVTEIVQSLLNLSTVNTDRHKDYYAFELIVKQALLMVKHDADQVVKISIQTSPLPMVYCDSGQIGQVLLNILVNAIQAIKSNKRATTGHIEVITYQEGGYICVSISDDGPGISEENLKRIFNPFFTTKEVGQGTGLGLSISFDIIVNKHQGVIDVKSVLEQGTTFIVKLPISNS